MTNQFEELNLPSETVEEILNSSDNLGKPAFDSDADDQSYDKPKVVIKNCLNKVYDAESIDDLLVYHLNETTRRIQKRHEFDTKVRLIVVYIFEYEEVEDLWSGIKDKNSKIYEEFYPQWEKAIKKQQEEEEEEEKEQEQAKKRKQKKKSNNQAEAKDAQSDSLESVDDIDKNNDDYQRVFLKERPQQFETDTPHPLEGDDMNVLNEWFFKQLGLEDRSLLLTVALFEGIDRRYVNIIAKDVADNLEPESKEENGGSHEQ